MSEAQLIKIIAKRVNWLLAYPINDDEYLWLVKTFRNIDLKKYREYNPQKIIEAMSSSMAKEISNKRQNRKVETYIARPYVNTFGGLPITPENAYRDDREEKVRKHISGFQNDGQNDGQNDRQTREINNHKKEGFDNKNKQIKSIIHDDVDMHEYQKYDLYHGAAPVTIGQNKLIYDVNQSNAFKIDVSLDVTNIFGLNNMTDIQNLFNPMAKSEKNYLVFDSRYRSVNTDGTKLFQWTYVPTANMQNSGIVNSVGEIRNVTEMRLTQPVFPALQTLDPTTNRVSILIQEFISQSFVASGTRNYHWLTRVDAGQSDLFVELQTEHYNDGVFAFREPITEISTLTFSFGNPLTPIVFPPDRANVTFIIYGATTTIESPTVHNLVVGSRIFLTDFITANPDADASAISYMNSPFGNVVTAIPTTRTFTIAVDTSTITPLPDLSIECYFEMFRFIFGIEFTCLSDANIAKEETTKKLIV